jgi:hypothetical protein
MSKTKDEEEKETIDSLGESFSWPILQLALVLDSLAFAIAAQSGVKPLILARQLEREARALKPEHKLAKAVLARMAHSVRKVVKKRAARGRRKAAS